MVNYLKLRIFVLFLAAWLAVPAGAEVTPEGDPEGRWLAGRLLVAAPSMSDPRFAGTVILLVRHDRNGAFGLVVNRAIGRGPIADLLEGAGQDGQGVEGEIAVHYGGPVEPRLGFVVHSADYVGPGTERVGERFAMTAEPAVLRAIGQGNGPKKRFFAFGYCGWAPDQLESELKRNDWVTVPADDSLVFGENLDEVWKRAFERRGFDL